MATINKLSGPQGIAGTSAQATGTAEQARGSWRGQAITAAPAGAAQAFLQPQESAARLPLLQRDLSSRRAALAPVPGRMSAADIFQRAQAQGVGVRDVRAQARAVLSGPKGAPGGKRDYSKTRYMALQLAAACLEDEASEDAVTAMLAPVREHAHKPQDLAEMLRHAAASDDDSEAFEHFREDVLSGLDTTSDDEKSRDDLVGDLRDGRVGDDGVMERLRKALKIPSLSQLSVQQRRDLRQKIQDEIADYASESTGQGKQVLAGFNAAPVAAGTANPATFLQTYTDLVTVSLTFAAAMKLLISRFTVDSLESTVDKLKKALGDDLEAATPSQDPRRLGAVLSDLGNMFILSSLIDSAKELAALIRRNSERDKDQKRKRGAAEEAGDEEAKDKENKKKVTGRAYGT